VRELAAGLSEPWQQLVSSYATDDGERLLLFDPLALPGELEELAARRQTVIVLTAPWHERDAQPLAERLGLPVFAPPPDTQEDLMQKYGVTAEQAAGGSPDLAWLRAGDGVEGHFYSTVRDWRSESRRSPAESTTTSCSGSKTAARSSPATRSSTSAAASKSRPSGCGRA
jgi:hypothetical protein